MTGVLAAYDALVAAGELRPDPEQAAAAAMLTRVGVSADKLDG